MPVKDFLSIKGAKQTVEKDVKQKPSKEDLVKVERPGKSLSALELVPYKKKSRKKRKKEKSEPFIISPPKKDSLLIITEKPQAAQKIAFALGEPKKQLDNKVFYYELIRDNSKIIIASAVGHLFNLTYVEGQKGWPVFKIQWVPSYERKGAEFTRRYYNLLKKLGRKAKEVIIATDYDIEGEVIGWNVVRFLFGLKTAKRMKYSTLTRNELINSYEHLLAEPDWGLAYSGETRHILDWLYGINLSRALMSAIKTTGLFKVLSIGRVQGPALKIIVDREHEIMNFESEPYWQVFAIVKGVEYKYTKDIFDKTFLDKFKNIKEVDAKTRKSEEHVLPPYPFDLTTLQREAYRHHNISPSQTLKIAQKLYLDGLISYPRTSSQKIPESIGPKKILKVLSKNFSQVKFAKRLKPVEGKKSDSAHPSIYPTGEFLELSGKELQLYELIVKRFISVFSLDAVISNKRSKLVAVDVKDEEGKNIIFSASGLKIIKKGWMEVYFTSLEEREIPDLNGRTNVDKIEFVEKKTQPPKRYTPASLITILEKKNLGTKATRSLIVDTLFNRGYLDGRSIKATPLGMKLISALEKYSPIIIDENLTRKIEREMEDFRSRDVGGFKEKENVIISKAEKIILDISKEFKLKEKEIGREISEGLEELRKKEYEENILLTCPVCKKGDLRILYSKKFKRYFVACSNYPSCTQTYSLPSNSLVKKSNKECNTCHFPKVLIIRKGKRPWELCFNPSCSDNIKSREEWEAKKNKS